LTWGRLQDIVDPAPLEKLIMSVAYQNSLGGEAMSAELCYRLQEAAGEPYFFECLFSMGQNRIPFGPGYAEWASETAEKMAMGKEIWYLGRSEIPKSAE
jgi:hypothetical protein